MFKRENLRKNFLRVKQNIDQNLGRAEQSKVLTEDQEENEKRVEGIKHAFQNMAKKAGTVIQATGADADKKLKKLPETGLSHAMTESAQSLGTDTLLGSVCQLCGDCEMSLAKEHVQFDETVEQEFITPLQTIVDVDIPGIIKWRKALTKSILDMDSAKSRLNQVVRQSQVPGANMTSAAAKADVIKDEYEEATLKMENIKDNLSIELCNFAAKESEQSNRLLILLEAQANYHRKALEAIEECIPQVTLAIKNSSAKPCFGMPLEEHLRLMCRDVAVVLEACVLTLLEIGMEEKGLFRIAGSAVKLKKLKACFDAHVVDMEEFSSDPHTVAGAIKLYLRELPEPLLTFDLYDDLVLAATLPQDQRLQTVWSVVNRLPRANYNNFRYLIKFLAKLAEKSEVNMMKPSNIAIVIGPNLMWSEKSLSQNVMSTGAVSGIIETVVSHADWFFPGAVDFHLTGHGSSTAPYKEPGFAHSTNTHPTDSKSSTEKKVSEERNEDNKFKEQSRKKDKEKEVLCDGTADGANLMILPVEQSVMSIPIVYQARMQEMEDEEKCATEEKSIISGKYQADTTSKKKSKPELELDFNFGYFSEDSQEGVHSEKPQGNTEAAHSQTTPTPQATQNTAPTSSPVASLKSATQSSSSNAPTPADSLDPTQKRAGRKPAPPPPADKPFKHGHNDSSATSGDVVDSNQFYPAPLATTESLMDHHHHVTGSLERDKPRSPGVQSERPSMPPPHRPDQTPSDRPKLPSTLNPPVPVRGHQRSASTGALINKSPGSLDNTSGLPNACSLSSHSIDEDSRDESSGYVYLNLAAVGQNVGPSSSYHQPGNPPSMRTQPTPPSMAGESEYTKL